MNISPLNMLTVDLEEWFVVEALTDRLASGEWEDLESTVKKNCHRLMDLFEQRRVRATWFVLGWVAERHPDLIRAIAERGHEIGCHSYHHRRIDLMTVDVFRADTERALEAITAAAGVRPRGYRAPSWSINDSIPWAFEVLGELEFDYDSSIYPIKHDLYGMPHGPRDAHKIHLENQRVLYEVPATTYRIFGSNVPVAGGGFLRHSPYWYSARIIRRLNAAGRPVVVYMHPWEIDPDPPRIDHLSPLQRFRTYGSTGIFYQKLDRLLGDFDFVTVADYVRSMKRRTIGFQDHFDAES